MKMFIKLINFILISLFFVSCGGKDSKSINENMPIITNVNENIPIITNVNEKTPLIIAHRGASAVAPENTLSASKLAFEMGADTVEIDVRLSKDNRIMVIHDETTERVGGINLVVEETISDDLRKLDVGFFKGPAYIGEKIPYLEEVIEILPPKKMLLIDVKSGVEIIPYLKRVLDSSGKIKQIEVTSHLGVIKEVINQIPEVPVYWSPAINEPEDNIINIAYNNGIRGLNINYVILTNNLIEKAKNRGLRVYVYGIPGKRLTLDYDQNLLNVQGIIDDKPERVSSFLKKFNNNQIQ